MASGMKFIDTATIHEDATPGVRFVSEDGRFVVAVCESNPGHPPAEWLVWQRDEHAWCRRGAPQFVRRVAWARFTSRQEAQYVAALLAALPATASLAVAAGTVRATARRFGTGVLFRALATAHRIAADLHERAAARANATTQEHP